LKEIEDILVYRKKMMLVIVNM